MNKKEISSPLAIGIIVVLAILLGGYSWFASHQIQLTETIQDTNQNIPGTPSPQDAEIEADYYETTNALFNKPYVEAKQRLATKGWTTYIPDDFTSTHDKTFPEIGDCGDGIDAICNVNFKKGDVVEHLNVQIGGREPYGPYTVWTVVGNE